MQQHVERGMSTSEAHTSGRLVKAAALCLTALILCLAAAPAAAAGEGPVLSYCYQGKLPETRLVVVDKSRQRILVFRYMGRLMLEYEYPCATGTNPGAKQEEGDERTPVGIYFTTHRYQDRKITIFGDRAIHLNYPNPFDRDAGRQGDGIYLHGTNQKLRPRSTNGCVTMRNQDLAVLEPLITEQLTPVVVVESLLLPPLTEANAACDHLRRLEASLPAGASQGVHLALEGNGIKHQRRLKALAPRLAGLEGGKGGAVSLAQRGLVLLGLNDQWVLVADQVAQGPGRRRVELTRRFYLEGDHPARARLVRTDWVVPSLAAAKRLAAWAPEPRPAEPASPASPEAPPRTQIVRLVQDWLKAWQSKNLGRYMSFYAADFQSDGKSKDQWRRHKAYLNKVYDEIEVTARKLKVDFQGRRAEVSFVQHYRSDWHRDVGAKRLVLERRGQGWRIVSESWNSLPGRAQGDKPGSRSS
jgi:murein L,D-transpeptidase YafK